MRAARDAIAGFLDAAIASGAMPGAAYWVGGPDGAIARGVSGHAAIEPRPIRLGEGMPFDLASLTKPLATALLAVLLERDRRLTLEATLGSILPELRATPYGSATLADAAAHRAGLPAWKPLYLEGSTREAYLRSIGASAPAGPAGATLYSDLGYLLLGFSVERAGGAPLDRLFDERIARPLGLRSCGFAAGSGRFRDAAATERGNAYERRLAGPAADPARFRDSIPRGEVHDGNAWGLGGVAGHAGLFGTAADVAKIALAILEPPRLGRPHGALAAMLRPAGVEAGSRTVGFLRAKDTESLRGVLPDDAVGHFGFTGTSVWLDPAATRVYVLLTNRVHPIVPEGDFVAVRRGFHALAAEAAPRA